MPNLITNHALSEAEFAELVETLAAQPVPHEKLLALLREDHPLYRQRGAAAVVRMRGWVLLALAREPLPDVALVFVLEELDTGIDPYLVAAAAYALRSYPKPSAAFAPFVLRALTQIRYHDEPVSFRAYGEYADSDNSTSPMHELLATLAWLGPEARGVLPEVEALLQPVNRFPAQLLPELNRALQSIRGSSLVAAPVPDACCALPGGLKQIFAWASPFRPSSASLDSILLEDQTGTKLSFKEFFHGQPTIVVFFYTRCDNPLKCSLTVTQLARVQKLLEVQGVSERVRTAAITYDSAYDLPERLRAYGLNRGVKLDAQNRMLRIIEGEQKLHQYFSLGVNFIESLVNRHRVEAFVLDAQGRVASSFERLHWEEQAVVERALEVLGEACQTPPPNTANLKVSMPLLSTFAALAVAFFPKCPICWAGYLSLFGIAGMEQIPYSPWLQPVFATLLLINVLSLWIRARATSRMASFYLASAGALVILTSKLGMGWDKVGVLGVLLTMAGSLLGAFSRQFTGFSFSHTSKA